MQQLEKGVHVPKSIGCGNIQPISDIVEKLINAHNSHEPNVVIDMYAEEAVLVSTQKTMKGVKLIHAFYKNLFKNELPDGNYQLIAASGNDLTRHFSWKATTRFGVVKNCVNTIELNNGKIVTHYLYYSTL